MEQWEKLLESLLSMVIKEGNPLRKKVESGLYLELRVNQNQFVKTVNNIRKKLSLRYINDKEGLFNADDIVSITLEKVIEVLFETYIGRVKLNGIDIIIPEINSYELDNETDEEKEFRAEQFLKLFTNENMSRYMSILYRASTQRDFQTNFKTNHMQTTTIVSQKKVNGKNKYVYKDVYNTSMDAPYVTQQDEKMNCIDYLYGKNLEMKDLCQDNVQLDINETSGLYQYILENYWNDLTNKQREWFKYALNKDEKFLTKGDEVYSARSGRQFKDNIRDRVFYSIENDENSKLYIDKNRKIACKRDNQISDVVKKLVNEGNTSNQIDMLISVLNKDNKCSELLVNHLLDEDLYYPICNLIIGEISRYKYTVIYHKKVISALEKLIQ